MNKEYFYFQKNYFLFLILLFSGFSVGLFYLHFSNPTAISLLETLAISGFFLGLIGLSYYAGKSRKIVVSEEGIQYIAKKSNFFIPWISIHSWGGYATNKYFDKNLTIKQLENKSSIFWGAKNLFVSTLPNFRPKGRDANTKDCISFPYQKDLLDLLQSKLNNPIKNE